MIVKRLPEVKTLYEILPKGTEGGKEFARVVDLLLFHEARRAGKKITIFSDVAGDYHGLDSFEGDIFRIDGTTGYQYKFYPSPLSLKHRKDIEKCLKQAAKSQKIIKIRKWILVTPQDLTESSTRKDWGDVTWFEGLRDKLDLKFELEHLGHKKILYLFLETPALCLFYYPELISDGATRKKTIQDIRRRYNDNLKTLYSKIEFVGMSVYKQEATKGVPMEHIYIPLTAVPEAADETNENVPRIDTLTFLKSGAHNVVLGDPGSGKSTLLRFLALAGFSKSLQQRYKAEPDDRLPILITLRRYADELKSQKNKSLIDYIQESIQGDFSLKSADLDFFEYYLESGRTILLFDGLDELPNSQFKKDVRDRIRALITTYPGNTTVVTSRIVGYDNPFRFDEKEFVHQRLTRLQLPEIEQFVKDWYRVRIENKQERDTNANDLIRILRDEADIAIRELSQNPLLLTIVVLVHRIDAVLPDERIVLYRKCIETLLNSWHTWKFRDTEVRNRGKIERRNRRRMEAIAYWMHCLSGGTESNQRAVVPYTDLKNFLTEYIDKTEKIRDRDNDPEDLADEFLEFVKKRAGLLIEIGDNQYSFVHLTFQEYLTASHIITSSEREGVSRIWETIKDHYINTRWHEVIRLLIADLKSDNSQEFLIKNILSERVNGQHMARSRLLGGLLLDGIDPAEFRKEEIFGCLLNSASMATNIERLRPITSMLNTCLTKDVENEKLMDLAFKTLWETTDTNKQKMALKLIAYAMNWPETKIVELTGDSLFKEEQETDLFRLFLSETSDSEKFQSLTQSSEFFWVTKNVFSLKSPYWNFVATTGQAITFSIGANITAKRSFEEQMVVLSVGISSGPFIYFTLNGLQIALEVSPFILRWARVLDQDLARDQDRTRALALARARTLDQVLDQDWVLDLARDQALDQVLDRVLALARARDRALALARARDLDRTRVLALARDLDRTRALARDRVLDLARDRVLALDWDLDLAMAQDRTRALALARARTRVSKRDFWQAVLVTPSLYSPILDFLCDTFVMLPRAQWWEALRVAFLPKIPQRITLFDETMWKQVEKSFETGDAGETEIYSAAWQLLFDSWLYIWGYYKSSDESIFGRLAELTRQMDAPPLRIAHCIRDLAYGDKSRTNDLVAMVKSDDPQYREIFEACLWRLTPKEEIKRDKKGKNIRKKKSKQEN
jgi:energy-coupling factor transporter ATP-binding protein EcfA2